VGEGGGVERGGFFDRPEGTCAPGVAHGGACSGAFEAFRRAAASRERTQAMKTGSFRTGFDWSIFAPALFPRVVVSVQVLGEDHIPATGPG
jgi:hypothetical protein